MAGITDGIEEPIKIIGYADDWIVHTTHQHQRVAAIRIQKAMNRIIKWEEGTVFKYRRRKPKLSCSAEENFQ
jgi:hypothetical protein